MVTIAWAGHPITWGARYWPVFLVLAGWLLGHIWYGIWG